MSDPSTTAPPPRMTNIPPRTRAPKQDAPTERIKRETPPPSLRTQAVIELIDWVQVPLVSLAAVQTMRAANDTFVSPYAMDAYAIEQHKQPLAEGIANLANNYPVLGALLDKISLVAPAGGLLTVGLSLMAQLLENHGVTTPLSSMPGVVPREELSRGLVEAGRARASANGNE